MTFPKYSFKMDCSLLFIRHRVVCSLKKMRHSRLQRRKKKPYNYYAAFAMWTARKLNIPVHRDSMAVFCAFIANEPISSIQFGI